MRIAGCGAHEESPPAGCSQGGLARSQGLPPRNMYTQPSPSVVALPQRQRVRKQPPCLCKGGSATFLRGPAADEPSIPL